MKQRAYGFTIVELLIVIVVIAILAAISVAAYSNIQGRARISAVHSDLSNAKKRLATLRVDLGGFPKSGPEIASAALRISDTSNYEIRPSYSNFYYCADLAGERFSIGARVADGGNDSYFITSESGVQTHAGHISQGATCSKIGLSGTGAADGAYSSSGISTAGTVNSWLGD